MTTTTIKVKGMSCQHCVMALQKALEGMDGVLRARVDLTSAEAILEHDRAVDHESIRQTVERAGYELG
jgi:copper chaperone